MGYKQKRPKEVKMKKSIFKQPHRSMPIARSIWWTNWLLAIGYFSLAVLLTAFFII